MATSVPAPMAMPMSARVSAGASLMPSPTMATLPRALQAADLALLCRRAARPRSPRPTPACAPMALAVRAVVAGEHDDADAHIRAARGWPARLSGLSTSATATMPRSFPPRAKNSGVLPASASACACACMGAGMSCRLVRMKSALPPQSGLPVRAWPCSPLPGSGLKVRDLGARSSRVLPAARRSTALASGCSLPALERAGQAQQLRLRHARGARQRSVTVGLPEVMVPVLSSATICDAVPVSSREAARLEEDAVFRAHAAADHDGHRGGEAERARAADDQHGDAARERVAHAVAEQQPDDERSRARCP